MKIEDCHHGTLYNTVAAAIKDSMTVILQKQRETHCRRKAQEEGEISEVRTLAVCRRQVAADHCTVECRPFSTPHITKTHTTQSHGSTHEMCRLHST